MSMLLSACGANGDLYQIEEPKVEQKSTAEESQQRIEKTEKKPK